ncbi:ABC transporter, ATP-binding protein [Ancylostoma duodenale]|uniref:ABC transporter, ATP-binding protein n=1 Tax=Ancylostoma duodenale TaxID=51022 RepID=A0A0C2CR53_9BILA|nr:ABC transporter, ATP-binding protein [Ancylostoma duodenale]
MRLKDERIRMTNEVLSGIKVVKLYAWEPALEDVVDEIRVKEMSLVRKAGIVKTLADMLNIAAPFLVALVTFATYTLSSPDNVLTPQIAFVSLTLFNQLRGPLMMAADLISQTVQVVVSNKRLKEFLIAEELSETAVDRDQDDEYYTDSADMSSTAFAWDRNEPPQLHDVCLKVHRGQLVAVVGTVGAGKSSEMEKLRGYVGVRGTVAYVPQQPWIRNGTLKDNIIMDKEFDKAAYEAVLENIGHSWAIVPQGYRCCRAGTIAHLDTYDNLLENPDASEILQESAQKSEEVPATEELELSEEDTEERGMDADEASQGKKQRQKLIEDETSALGRVKFSIYLAYFNSMGIFRYFIPFLITLTLNSVFVMLRSLWLTDWSNDNIPGADETLAKPLGIRLGVYALIGSLEVICLYLALTTLILGGVAASLKLHKPLLHNILRSPLSHFDVTPLGRILNRLGKTCIIISISTPLFIVVIIPIFVIYLLILRYFIPCSRQLQRLASLTRSPIYSHFGESVQGSTTIRAFGWTEMFKRQNKEKMVVSAAGAFGEHATSLLAVMSRDWGTITAGAIGLSVSYSLNAPWRRQRRPPAGWPSKGEVDISGYSTRYRPGLDLVLKGLSVHISAGEKVGVVGRTGAGKSSLTLALFRIIEPAGGSILLDGVDITSVGLHDLRERLTIIPQDPVLFSGTLRFNLDPTSKYSDAEIWSAIEMASLKPFVESLPFGLQHQIDESGENISVGQRQLVCLTRALLRKSRILVLDEATAAIDGHTDALIQGTIRKQFEDSTVITIAHRLNTILDYDRVLVMESGRVAEFAPPQQLLANKNSIFYSMAASAGLV